MLASSSLIGNRGAVQPTLVSKLESGRRCEYSAVKSHLRNTGDEAFVVACVSSQLMASHSGVQAADRCHKQVIPRTNNAEHILQHTRDKQGIAASCCTALLLLKKNHCAGNCAFVAAAAAAACCACAVHTVLL
eukprot:16974-Heterococcus_DN1.PRE.2